MNDKNPNNGDINDLDKTYNDKPIESDHKAEYVAHFNKFFDTFKCNITDYDYNKSMEVIDDYCKDYMEYDIIPYSDITNYIFDISDKQINMKTFVSQNLELCFKKIYNELLELENIKERTNEEDIEYKNKHTQYQMVLRMHSHVDLAIIQSDTFYRINNALKDEIEKEMKEKIIPKIEYVANENKIIISDKVNEFKQDIKKSERDYITILGIFVAIILAFMGSIIIPSNIISNAANIGTAKLILLMSGVSFIFINILYLLIKFIAIINEKEEGLKKLIPLCKINIVLFIVFVLSLLGVFYTKDFEESQKNVSDNAAKLSIELQK